MADDKKPDDAARQGLDRIRNGNDLLGDALKGLSDEELSKVAKSAAAEALRIRAKEAEMRVQSDVARQDVQETVETARQLHQEGHRAYSVESESQTGSGKTNVSIRKGMSVGKNGTGIGCSVLTVVILVAIVAASVVATVFL